MSLDNRHVVFEVLVIYTLWISSLEVLLSYEVETVLLSVTAI